MMAEVGAWLTGPATVTHLEATKSGTFPDPAWTPVGAVAKLEEERYR
jgi:hypothetical protein